MGPTALGFFDMRLKRSKIGKKCKLFGTCLTGFFRFFPAEFVTLFLAVGYVSWPGLKPRLGRAPSTAYFSPGTGQFVESTRAVFM